MENAIPNSIAKNIISKFNFKSKIQFKDTIIEENEYH